MHISHTLHTVGEGAQHIDNIVNTASNAYNFGKEVFGGGGSPDGGGFDNGGGDYAPSDYGRQAFSPDGLNLDDPYSSFYPNYGSDGFDPSSGGGPDMGGGYDSPGMSGGYDSGPGIGGGDGAGGPLGTGGGGAGGPLGSVGGMSPDSLLATQKAADAQQTRDELLAKLEAMLAELLKFIIQNL